MTLDAQTMLAGRFDHVLVVEDDPVLSRVLVRTVSKWGGEVRAVRALHEAVRALGPPIDLLIADVRLPDGTSHRIFERAARMKPAPLMIAISGKASATEGFGLARAGAQGFLAKPFGRRELEHCVCESLEQRELQEMTSSAAFLSARDLVDVELARFARRHALSDRQTHIIRLLLSGVSRMELPAALVVSQNTCKGVVRRLLKRCEAERLMDIVRSKRTWTLRERRSRGAS